MQVVFTHTDFGPYMAEKLEALHRALAAQGMEFIALEGAGGGGLYSDLPAESRHASWRQCLYPHENVQDLTARQIYAACFAALDRLRPDVVMAWAVAFPTGAAAVCWAAKRKVPVVFMDDARRRNVTANPVTNIIKRCFHANCDAAFVSAPSFREDYEWWGFPSDRQFYGVNCSMNHTWHEWHKEAIASELSLRKNLDLPDRYFLGVGRLIPAKNWLRLLEAYRQYAGSVPVPADFVLIGDGPDHSELVRLANSLPRGKFHLRPSVPRKDLAAYYSFCMAFVLPSINETWGNVVNEAMCCRAPVLVSRLCGCSDSLVRDGANGYLLDPFDISSMADMMGNLAGLPDDRRLALGDMSARLVGEWDFNCYLDGATNAIRFCLHKSKRRGPWWSRLVMPLWKGRYRPV